MHHEQAFSSAGTTRAAAAVVHRCTSPRQRLPTVRRPWSGAESSIATRADLLAAKAGAACTRAWEAGPVLFSHDVSADVDPSRSPRVL